MPYLFRVEAGVYRLAELNPNVAVKGISEPFGQKDGDWEFLSQYKVSFCVHRQPRTAFYCCSDVLTMRSVIWLEGQLHGAHVCMQNVNIRCPAKLLH